ncbi:MAG TPA: ATP-binding cassette domain-containing protein [Cellvibrionaceae bacterium]|nr:ATP-binding cassette domain-containing protein [Cellvibrionaceae bacterium]HMW71592.1 ATP-binding cassette domain-containing protein [Cellvibrionaceae bacterium]HMY40905.1 ATP-binding cassette domain-containing protein [Marinagarivorans sp.]HNG60503.1 ATP-binding cassette domain-containing protein [Cellvibrionaceae bacterium]
MSTVLEVNIQFQRGSHRLIANACINAPITGILGASGSGKSTFLSAIVGLIKPHQGIIKLNGKTLFNASSREWVPPHKRRIGLVFQDGQLLPHLSVKRNLLYGYHNTPHEERRFTLDSVVELLELAPLLNRHPKALSGGERQRVALGRAVLYSPHLLLLDEPLSALDERLKQQILPFFARIYSECTIPMIYVSHAQSEIDYLTDTCLQVADGELKSL